MSRNAASTLCCSDTHVGRSDVPNYVFVLAASHSGSTLLSYLLASHPEATTIGETSGIIPGISVDRYLCSCGEPIKDCSFWGKVAQGMRRRGEQFAPEDFDTRFLLKGASPLNRLLQANHRGPILEWLRDLVLTMNPSWKHRFMQLCARNVALVEAVREITGTRILIDSSKHPERLKFLLRIPEFAIRVIHLVRDGRGVALTYMEQNGWPMTKAALEWRRNVLSEEKCCRTFSPDILTRVRYEDYCGNVEDTLQHLFGSLGLDPSVERSCFRLGARHVVGNGMRLETTTQVRLDEKWKSVLSNQEIEDFDRIAGTLNRKYGYD